MAKTRKTTLVKNQKVPIIPKGKKITKVQSKKNDQLESNEVPISGNTGAIMLNDV